MGEAEGCCSFEPEVAFGECFGTVIKPTGQSSEENSFSEAIAVCHICGVSQLIRVARDSFQHNVAS